MKSTALAALFYLLFTTAPAWAAHNYRFSHLDITYNIAADGKVTTHYAATLLAENDAGMRELGQFSIPYNAELQQVELTEAATLKHNGQRLEVDRATAVFDKPQAITVDAPQFSQMHSRVITYPALEVGDSIRVAFTQTDISTLYPGKFIEEDIFPQTEAYDDVNITIRLPQTMAVQLDVRALQQQVSQEQGQQIYKFHYSNSGQEVDGQSNAVAWEDIAPRWMMTNFADYAEAARAYGAGDSQAAAVTPAIQQLADQLTQGSTDRRQQAQRLYQWVSQNIRYVGVYIGAGAVIPHSADSVLANRYGDCKDHAVLFKALLQARGIVATTALINWSNSFTVSSAPSPAFNHAITYIPEFDLFADTTAGFASFGSLPFGESDKPALLIDSGELKHTPVANSQASQLQLQADVLLDKDGNAQVTEHQHLMGQIAEDQRRFLASSQAPDIERHVLQAFDLHGHWKADIGQPKELGTSYDINASGHLDDLADFPGPGGFALPMLPTASTIKSFAQLVLQQQNQTFPGVCYGSRLEEHYRIVFPDTVKVSAIPRAVDITVGELHYTAHYQLQGNTVQVTRLLERNLKSNVCTPEQLRSWVPLARAIERDLRGLVIY